MNPPNFTVVIPARYGSTRFPGKPLARIAGRPLIEWVHRATARIQGAETVIVATDDERIRETVVGFGGRGVLTSGDHRTGTDRVAAVARELSCEYVVNLQGDEPVLPPGLVETMMLRLAADPAADIVTACHPIRSRLELENPNVVKVVMDAFGRAMYFSRSPIPHLTGEVDLSSGPPAAFRHIGIYGYRRTALVRFAELPPTPLESSERLEQLRALENGLDIQVVISSAPTLGVDVPEDIKNVEKALAADYTGTLEKRTPAGSNRPTDA
jgi:3-deoxy-manno-octulosonate cytidylyltransferase (CMP-KDO synthetase)